MTDNSAPDPQKLAPLLGVGSSDQLGPDGKLHADGYFTWTRRNGYVLDARLPAEFVTVERARAALKAAQAELERLRAENAALKRDLQYARDGLTKGRTRMREDNERLAREAHTWSKAAETYAAELERYKPLMRAVEWILEDGHMNQEHLARLRAAWEAA